MAINPVTGESVRTHARRRRPPILSARQHDARAHRKSLLTRPPPPRPQELDAITESLNTTYVDLPELVSLDDPLESIGFGAAPRG